VVRYLLRRAAHLPLVLVLTYRDDELGTDHPLRRVLGLAAQVARVRRLRLAPLSRAAVRQLTGAAGRRSSGVDAGEVFAVTTGNPYFVTEILAAADVTAVPSSVAHSVLARMAGLEPATVEIVEGLAAVPAAVPSWLLKAIVPAGLSALAPAEQRGLLTVTPRHEAGTP
jgi:hypothetical protein